MSGVEVVTPEQVLNAINYVRSTNKNDKFGDGAFRASLSNIRNGSNNVRYIGFEILKQKGNKWEYVLLNLKFCKLFTKSRILPPDHEKRKYPGVQLQVADDSYWEEVINGKHVKQEYGTAKIIIAKAFQRIMLNAIETGMLFNSNLKISTPVQFQRTTDEKTKKKEDMDHPIIRISIGFKGSDDLEEDKKDKSKKDKSKKDKSKKDKSKKDKSDSESDSESESDSDSDKKNKKNKKQVKKQRDMQPGDKPNCDIYDITRPIDKTNKAYKPGDFNYEKLMYKVGEKYYDLTYENIGEVILPGSVITGIDNMSSIAVSNMGISLPSKVSLLLVKPSKGYKPSPLQVFSANEIESFANETTKDYTEGVEEDEVESTSNSPSKDEDQTKESVNQEKSDSDKPDKPDKPDDKPEKSNKKEKSEKKSKKEKYEKKSKKISAEAFDMLDNDKSIEDDLS